MSERSKSSLRGLRTRIARALEAGQRGRTVLAQLDSLVREAAPGSEEALFAHRQLAELRMDDSPWRAALHLRQIVQAGTADDGVHALTGLSFALLGSFRAAVAAYRRALNLAPDNPWYHHNLGHLLDVGLGESQAALVHLRRAHELAPREPAIGESLAHCLTRLGVADEARAVQSLASQSAQSTRERSRTRTEDAALTDAQAKRSLPRAARSRRSRREQSGGG
jgi:Flp pilus assembly protein TadD